MFGNEYLNLNQTIPQYLLITLTAVAVSTYWHEYRADFIMSWDLLY
jgi:hypothetical protein